MILVVSDLSVRFDTHEVLLHYLVTGEHPKCFPKERLKLVKYGMGIVRDADVSQIFIDEPTSLVGAARWFTMRQAEKLDEDSDNDDTEVYTITDLTYLSQSVKQVSQRPHSTAPYVALYLAHAFDGSRLLSDVFTFPDRSPSWAEQTARLVIIHPVKDVEDLNTTEVRSSEIWTSATPLAVRSKSYADTIAWLKHDISTPFCIPSSPNSDLIFVLKLADGRLMWVVLHSHVPQEAVGISDDAVREILANLLPQNMVGEMVSQKDLNILCAHSDRYRV